MDDGDRAPIYRRIPGPPVKAQFAAVGAFLAGNDPNESALSGPVWSGDAEYLTGPDVEVDSGQRNRVAVTLLQAADRYSISAVVHAALRLRILVSTRSRATAPMVTKPRKSCCT